MSHVGLPFAYCPGLHCVQEAEPAGLTQPDAHVTHEPALVPGDDAYVPTGQLLQPFAPAADH